MPCPLPSASRDTFWRKGLNYLLQAQRPACADGKTDGLYKPAALEPSAPARDHQSRGRPHTRPSLLCPLWPYVWPAGDLQNLGPEPARPAAAVEYDSRCGDLWRPALSFLPPSRVQTGRRRSCGPELPGNCCWHSEGLAPLARASLWTRVHIDPPLFESDETNFRAPAGCVWAP